VALPAGSSTVVEMTSFWVATSARIRFARTIALAFV
jgi:hypothetical protein